MMVFWSVAGLLVAVALAFVLVPLLRRSAPAAGGVDNEQVNLRVYRDQLAELEADHRNGVIADEQYEQGRQELERRLLEDVTPGPPPAAPASVPPAGSQRAVAAVVAIAVPVMAVGLYFAVGSPQALKPQVPAEAGKGPGHSVTPEMIEGMVEKLATKLQQNPNDLEGWKMMAKSMSVLGRHSEAAFAFQQAVRLAPKDADLLADFADAMAMSNGESLAGQPTQLIEQALQINPNHEKALWLAGSAAFERKDYKAAKSYFERLLQLVAPDSQDAQIMRTNIAEAEAALTGKPMPTEPAPEQTQPASGGGKITGVVKLSPALAAKVAPGDTLFVFARAAQGPRMPLAIMRVTAKDLPMRFTLDDSMAMAPNMNLSRFPEVVVGARVSKSGNAMPQSGDMQGQKDAVKVGADGVEIVIDQVVP